MAAYNRWMNEKLYAAAAGLPDAERKRDLRAFFKSLHGTLNHLLLGDRVWMGRFTGEPFKVRSLADELYADFDELRAERVKTDRHIVDWAASLSDERIAGDFTFTSIVNPAPRTIPMRHAVTHFFNHQTHHRGQATTVLMQLGVDPGATDLLWLPELQAN